jgi:hypothetical protein
MFNINSLSLLVINSSSILNLNTSSCITMSISYSTIIDLKYSINIIYFNSLSIIISIKSILVFIRRSSKSRSITEYWVEVESHVVGRVCGYDR